VVNTNGLLDYYNGVIRRRLGANEDISNDVLTRLLLFNTLSRWSYANSPINPHPKNPNSDRRSAAVIFAADPTECSMPFLTTDHKALGHGELFRILFFGDSLDNAQPKFDKQGNNKPNSSQTSEDTSSFFHGGFRRKKFTKRRRRTTKKRKTRFLR
jgi:hypothetical protein